MDTLEQYLPGGLAWHEAEAVPMLVDYECGGCGLIPGLEVVACSCGNPMLAGAESSAGITTTTSGGSHVAVIRRADA